MRAVVRFSEAAEAYRAADVLLASGIECNVSESQARDHVVWVMDERRLEDARRILAAYRSSPTAPEYGEAVSRAQALRRQRLREAERARPKTVDVRKRWRQQSRSGIGTVTLVLICISIAVTVAFKLDPNQGIERYLLMATSIARGQGAAPFGLNEIFRGEVWRLVTPIFLHFDILHILLNMLWLRVLGTEVEQKCSPTFLIVFVLVVAILSNLTQLVSAGSPSFGGMSGVVYALLGYVWLRGRIDPASGFSVSQSTVVFMLIWLVMGFTGVSNIANGAHAGGLIAGAAWGAIQGAARKRR